MEIFLHWKEILVNNGIKKPCGRRKAIELLGSIIVALVEDGFILTKKKLFIRLIMTRSNFYALCSTYNIDVNIALENDDLIELLKSKASYETIETFLKEEF